MDYHIRHSFEDIEFAGKKFYVTSFFRKLHDQLIERYPEHCFTIANEASYEIHGYGGVHSCMNFSIINPASGNYVLLSFFDNWRYHFMQHMGWRPDRMKQFFYAGGFDYLEYFSFKATGVANPDLAFPEEITKVFQPLYYSPYFDCCYEQMGHLFETRKSRTRNRKLLFRGYLWDFRQSFVANLTDDSICIIDKNQEGMNLEYLDYLSEMADCTASLSLPGGTAICNRDIESFAIGVPVVRPHLQVNYPDPLIPNFHYISCYHSCDYSDDGHPRYLSTEDFRKHLLHTWNKVRDNTEYLDFVAENARRWFVRNCSADSNLRYVIDRLDLASLGGP